MNLPPEYQNMLKEVYFEATGYYPFPAQQKIHYSTAKHRVAVCGRRFGKTLLAAKEVAPFLCNSRFEGYRAWIVAPHHDGTDKVFREIWSDLIVKGHLPADKITKKSWTDQSRIIRTAWGSEVIGKTAKNVDSLVGDEVDLLIFDEAAKAKERVWTKYLSPTLLDRNGRALFITTPEGQNWIHRMFNLGMSDDPDYESFHFTSYERPNAMQDAEKAKEIISEIEQNRKNLPESDFMQEWMADFFVVSGRVYKDYDPESHVVKWNQLPDTFDEIILGVDYGFVNPCAILVIGIKDSRYYVLEEIYKPGLQDRDISNIIKDLRKRYRISRIYADHEAQTNKYLHNNGINVIKAKKDVKEGIRAVASKLILQADGDPKLFIVNTCTNLIKEIEMYCYQDQRKTNLKEEPVKLNDHAVDALRYAIYSHEHKSVVRTLKGSNL